MDNLQEVEFSIDNLTWLESKKNVNKAPHEYIVRDNTNYDIIDKIIDAIDKYGHDEYFFNYKQKYLTIGDYTYWFFKTKYSNNMLLCRRFNYFYSVDERNQIHFIRDGKVNGR